MTKGKEYPHSTTPTLPLQFLWPLFCPRKGNFHTFFAVQSNLTVQGSHSDAVSRAHCGQTVRSFLYIWGQYAGTLFMGVVHFS